MKKFLNTGTEMNSWYLFQSSMNDLLCRHGTLEWILIFYKFSFYNYLYHETW